MNPLEKLKNLTNSMRPEKMAMTMLDQFLPQIKSFADNLNRPEGEGGILKEEEGQATIMIDFSADKPSVYVATFRLEGEATVLNRAIDIQYLINKKQVDGQ
jgi:hypothetical protein